MHKYGFKIESAAGIPGDEAHGSESAGVHSLGGAATSSEHLFCLGETLGEQLVVARWSLRELEQGKSLGDCVTFPASAPRPFGRPQLRLIPGQPDRVNLQFFSHFRRQCARHSQ